MKNFSQTISTILLIALLCSVSFWFGIQIEKARPRPVPTIAEIQEMVGAVPDGVIGTETLALWDKVIGNQYAQKYDYFYE